MTYKRKLYYRRKDKSVIIEGKANGKTVFIWTLPKDPEQLLRNLQKASFFPRDKWSKICENILRLDYRIKRNDET